MILNLFYNPISLLILIATLLFLIRVMLFKTELIYTTKKLHRTLQDTFHLHQFLKVPEFNESMQPNPLYRKLSLYLHSLPSIQDSDFTNLITGHNQNDIVLSLDPNQSIEDHFLGATLIWFNKKMEPNRTGSFLLRIRKTDKRRILQPYLRHIHTVAGEIEQQGKRDLRLFMNSGTGDGARWRSVPFNHPSMFETIMMEPDLKNKIKSDLESFLKARSYYRRLGRVWRRSFLLYGASGTGKSSFVAAMANFLCYDVYDVDLSKVRGDSDLKLLLLETTSKSIVVVEDLDRFLNSESKSESESVLSALGIQNFMDGIVSTCCGEEKVMVFTMCSKDRVDPNLLRPGRVDVHINFPECDFSAFKAMASSYLGVREHKLFPTVEEIFRHGASLSPAEIGGLMIANRNSPSRAIKSVIGALRTNGDGRGYGDVIERLGGGDVDDGENENEKEKVLCGEGFSTVRDFRRLYGLFKLRNRRRSQTSNSVGHDR